MKIFKSDEVKLTSKYLGNPCWRETVSSPESGVKQPGKRRNRTLEGTDDEGGDVSGETSTNQLL